MKTSTSHSYHTLRSSVRRHIESWSSESSGRRIGVYDTESASHFQYAKSSNPPKKMCLNREKMIRQVGGKEGNIPSKENISETN